jgi:competence protein ComFC
MFREGNILKNIYRLRESLLDLLYPRDCIQCGGVVPDSAPLRYLCSSCFLDVEIFKPPCCKVCGFPFYGIVVGARTCPHCKDLNPKFERGHTAFHLDGPMRELVHALKYQRGFYAIQDLIAVLLMAPGIRELLVDAVLVPVPLHPWRLFRRSYNQSLLIAKRLVREVPGARVENLLQRVRWTGSQTRLSRHRRQRNMRGAFALKKGFSVNPNNHYVVLDDVFTTGSTLNACCVVLRRGAATNLDILALGHG